jgi:AraC-like DNA-binding protein
MLFFLCLIALFVLLYQINLSMVSRSYLDGTEKLLKTGIANLETDLSDLDAVANAIYRNPRFRWLSYTQANSVDYNLVNDFKGIFASEGLIRDCGIVFENNMILTNKRLYFPWESFYGNFFSQQGVATFEQWIAGIPGGDFTNSFIPQSCFIVPEGDYEAITFCANFTGAPEKRIFFFATLEKEYILSRLATDDILKKGGILIYAPDGKLLIDSGAPVRGKDSLALEMSGLKRGMRVRVAIPREIFRRQLVPFYRMAFISIMACLTLGIVLSVIFARRSARPIRELVDDVLKFGGRDASGGKPADFKNDYSFIRHFLSQAERDLETFNERFTREEALQRENLFERFLYGQSYSASLQTIQDFFPGFPPAFRIAAVELPDMEAAALSAYTMRQTMIHDIACPHLPAGAYIHFSGSLLVLLLPDEAIESLLSRLYALTADLRLKINARCRAALSDCEREPRDIHRAFFLVRHLLRLPARDSGNDILQKGNGDGFSFPLELLDASRLYELLLHGEEDKAVDFINTMFYELCRRGFTSEDDIQQIFFVYRRALLQIAGDMEMELPEGTIPAYNSHQEVSFLFAQVAAAARSICALINARRIKKNTDFERSVIEYIDANITNSGLYTQMVTGFFSFSEDRLQAIVRKWTGKSFLEYAESRRMALSREILAKTAKTIEEVARECGYSSGNSFYKAFRRFYGQSPSELRGS